MTKAISPKKIKLARLSGSVYYILLGLANMISMAYDGILGWKDFVIMALVCTPLLVNRKFYYMLFGGLTAIFWVFILFSVFRVHAYYVRTNYEPTNPFFSLAGALTLGYIFIAASLFFSLALVYAGIYMPSKRKAT